MRRAVWPLAPLEDVRADRPDRRPGGAATASPVGRTTTTSPVTLMGAPFVEMATQTWPHCRYNGWPSARSDDSSRAWHARRGATANIARPVHDRRNCLANWDERTRSGGFWGGGGGAPPPPPSRAEERPVGPDRPMSQAAMASGGPSRRPTTRQGTPLSSVAAAQRRTRRNRSRFTERDHRCGLTATRVT